MYLEAVNRRRSNGQKKKDHGYFPFAIISLFMTYNRFYKNNTTVPLEEWELFIFLEHIPSLAVFSGVRVEIPVVICDTYIRL
jgi:hypothetical protein